MSQKLLISGIIMLLVTNVLTGVLLMKDRSSEKSSEEVNATVAPADEKELSGDGTEVVAEVGDRTITEDELILELKAVYGEEQLKMMINREVVRQYAKSQGITVSEEKISQEIDLMKAMIAGDSAELSEMEQAFFQDEERLKEDIEYSLLLEELLTRDIVVSEDEIARYYEENEDLFHSPPGFLISHIIVSSEEEADQVVRELENGSNFSVLAMEKSQDDFSANQGGSLGFIPEDGEIVPESYIKELEEMKPGDWSRPVKVEEGYAIVLLEEKVSGKSFSFSEVKDQIRRQIAIGQINDTYSPEPFWSEVGVDWIYEHK